MNTDDELDGLNRISRVDAPPFLYTRIRARIDLLAEAPAPVQWVRAFAAAALLVLLLNAGVFLTATDDAQTSPDVANVVTTMQLMTNNDFYHE